MELNRNCVRIRRGLDFKHLNSKKKKNQKEIKWNLTSLADFTMKNVNLATN